MIKKRGKHGFTLIELTVSIAVIAVVLVLVVLGLNRVRGENELDRGAAEFAVQLRITQNYADTYQINDQLDTTPAGGYGIHYDYPGGTSYLLFANVDDQPGSVSWDETSDLAIQTFNLPTGVEFIDCQYYESPSAGVCDIVFELGEDVANVVTDDGYEPEPENFVFILKEITSGEEKSVIIKKWAGLIYEE